ncbi:MAG: hypothetical protein HMLKMBBP_01159 [Planctomycetes bacterium]|nr:hypothetical protein [Planctomycetota bacterium]
MLGVMSKRLQVLVPEPRWPELRRIARSEGLSVGEFVRRVPDDACRRRPTAQVGERLTVIDRAMAHSFPTCDVEQMNAEIESGYAEGPEE